MKRRTSEGLGAIKSASPVSVTMEDKLWKDGLLSKENGKLLFETVLYLLGVNLGLKGGLEHKRLRQPGFNPQITVIHDFDGFKCLHYKDLQGKTHQGGVNQVPFRPEVVNV